MEWTKVKDEFPEENKKILGIWGAGTSGVEMITVYWSKEDGWYNQDLELKQKFHITYWAELPDYPTKFW